MEAKDVALYGFVAAANDYVNKHLNDGTELGNLKNIDIENYKKSLSNQLASLVMPEEYKKDLLNVGVKAFEQYAKDNLKPKRSVIDQLGEIFNVSFDDEEEVPETKEDINEILDAYDLDEKVAVTSSINNAENDDLDEFGLSANDDILMQIANAASKSDEELAKTFEESVKKPANLDSVFADVVSNEADKKTEDVIDIKSINELSRAIGETAIEDKAISADVIKILSNAIYNTVTKLKEEKNTEVISKLSEAISSIKLDRKNEKEAKESVDPEIIEAEPETIFNTVNDKDTHTPLSQLLRGISEAEAFDTGYFNTIEVEHIEDEEDMPKFEPLYKYQEDAVPAESLDILINPGLDVILEREKDDAQSYFDIAQQQEEEKEKEIEEATNEEEVEDEVLSKAISGLNNLQKKQEENRVILPVDPNDSIYQNIMIAYPYLNKGFIKSVYAQKTEIEEEYEEDRNYILLHRLVFTDLDELHEFVEIMMGHDYSVNVDEKQMIVDTFKEFVNTEGIILTNILSIANQAKILNGEYDGYRVITL